jgi:hypothetical protein
MLTDDQLEHLYYKYLQTSNNDSFKPAAQTEQQPQTGQNTEPASITEPESRPPLEDPTRTRISRRLRQRTQFFPDPFTFQQQPD